MGQTPEKFMKNLISSFFIRITLLLFLLSVLWLGLVYIYEMKKTEKILITEAENHLVSFFKVHRMPVSESDAKELNELIGKTGEKIQGMTIVLVKVYDENKNKIFEFVTHDKSHEGVLKGYHSPRFKAHVIGNSEYDFYEADDRIYLQGLAPVYYEKRLLGFMEGLVEIDQKHVEELKKGTFAMLVVTTLTVLLVALVTYPLIHFSYRSLRQSRRQLLISNLSTILVLGNAIAKRDSDTDEHNYRVVYFSVCLGEHLKLPDDLIRTLMKGAFLHDAGKIGISDNILLKPGCLSEEESVVMKTHVDLGTEIVEGIPWLSDAIDIIRFHHEKYDGSGYNQGLKGEEIPVTARIFSLVDVFDALTSNRPYKKAFSYAEAINIMKKGHGSHFDPKLLQGFLEISAHLYDETNLLNRGALENRLREKASNYFGI